MDDGISDLVIGEKNCNLNFAKGLGNGLFDPVFPGLGNVNACAPGYLDGNAHPRFLKIGDSWKLFLGTNGGAIKAYGNIEGNLFGTFALQETNYGNLKAGNQTHLDLQILMRMVGWMWWSEISAEVFPFTGQTLKR